MLALTLAILGSALMILTALGAPLVLWLPVLAATLAALAAAVVVIIYGPGEGF